jgi:hypothetical protein
MAKKRTWRRLPIIRHIRAVRAWIAVDRHYRLWASLGMLPVNRDSDEAHVAAIWRGDAE